MSIIDKLSDFLDLEKIYFGKLLGNGQYSVAIKVDYPFITNEKEIQKLSSPVMIITKEKEKYEIMKSLFGKDLVAKVNPEENFKEEKRDWLSNYDFATEEDANEEGFEFIYDIEASEFNLNPLFMRIQEEGLYVFFMEKAKPYNSFETTYIDKFFYNDTGNSSFFQNFDFDFEDYKEEIEVEVERKYRYSPYSKEELLEKTLSLLNIINRDIKKIANTIESGYLELDIHDEQFLEMNGKIYCSDPFIIN